MPSALYQDNDEKQNQVNVKSCFAPVVTPKASQDQDSALFIASLAHVEAVDASLNSSGYTSANSPVVSISPVDAPSVERKNTPDPLSINIHSHVLGNSQTRDEANQITRISQVQGSANSVVVSDSLAPFLITAVAPPDPPLKHSPVSSGSNSWII